MSKRINLTQGKSVIVDDDDYEWLSKNNWYAHKQGKTWYAKRTTSINYHVTIIHMHREIMGLGIDNGKVYVDHIDGNGLNNAKSNLRLCTKAQNGMNRGPQRDNSSGYKGVGWDRSRHKWRAQITVNGKNTFIGRYNTKEKAARAYDKKAKELYGEFAYTNFD